MDWSAGVGQPGACPVTDGGSSLRRRRALVGDAGRIRSTNEYVESRRRHRYSLITRHGRGRSRCPRSLHASACSQLWSPATRYARPVRLNPVLDQIGSYAIAAIQGRARSLRDAGEPLVDFSIGDPREPTPPFIPAALKAAVPVISQYPTIAGLPRLRRSIAGYVERRFGVAIDPDTEVLPTTGSKEAIFSTPLAFIDREAGGRCDLAHTGLPDLRAGRAPGRGGTAPRPPVRRLRVPGPATYLPGGLGTVLASSGCVTLTIRRGR